MVKTISRLMVLMLALLSVACGGGGGGSSPAPSTAGGGGGGGGGPTNLNSLLNGNYYAVVGVVGAQRATIIGPVTFNGAGAVTGAGAMTVRSAAGLTAANVTPSTYTVDNNRNTTATINTDVGFTLQQVMGRTTADGRIAAGLSNSQGSQSLLLLVQRATGLNPGALTGTLRLNLAFITPAAPGTGGGTLTLNNTGNVTGGQLTDAQGQASNVTGGNYTIDGNANFAVTINLANARIFTATGAAGQDGTLIFSFFDGLTDYGFGTGSRTLAGASNASLNGTMGVYTLGVVGTVGYAGGSASFNGGGAITAGQLVTNNNQAYPVSGNYAVAGDGTTQAQLVLQGLGTVTVNGHIHESGNLATGTGLDNQGGRSFSALVR